MAAAEGAGAGDGGQLGHDAGGRHGKRSASSLDANWNDEPTLTPLQS